jgi:hypothetical protein
VFVFMEMIKMVKIEDWFKDGSTVVKTVRKGKGRNIYIDSTLLLRLQVIVDGVSILSNYPLN